MTLGKTTKRTFERPKPEGRWRLRVTDGAAIGLVFDIPSDLEPRELVLGKASDADIQLTDSGVSRRHAKLMVTSDGLLMLIDLESTNGTFVDGTRIELGALRPGQRIRLGPDVELELELVADEQAQPVALTPRELEVARLASQGLRNSDIATALGIRPRTVATHIENIYRRLHICTRAELARCLTQEGVKQR